MTPDALADLHNACFPQRIMSVDQAAKLLCAPATRLLSEPNGFLIASVVPPEADITSIGVHPDVRRSGIARRLVTTLQDQVSSIFLEVAETNVPAVRLYESMGFNTVNIRRNYYSIGATTADALLMSWSSVAAEDVTPQESVDPPGG